MSFGNKEKSIGCKRMIWKAGGVCRLPLNVEHAVLTKNDEPKGAPRIPDPGSRYSHNPNRPPSSNHRLLRTPFRRANQKVLRAEM